MVICVISRIHLYLYVRPQLFIHTPTYIYIFIYTCIQTIYILHTRHPSRRFQTADNQLSTTKIRETNKSFISQTPTADNLILYVYFISMCILTYKPLLSVLCYLYYFARVYAGMSLTIGSSVYCYLLLFICIMFNS